MTQSSQRFCLRWNNHQSNLLSVFDQLLQDESFVDVTLAVEGQFLRAHKMVLSACSPYFQTLFVGHPDKHPIVILKDVPFADMRSLLDFMYRGEVSVDQDRLSAFLKVAESLRIKGLTEVNEDKCDTQSSLSSLISNPPSSSSAPPPPDLHRIQLSQPSHKRSSTPSSLNGATSPYSQKRKRGRPRKLSESSDGGDESPDRDSAVLDSDSKQLDSSYGNGPPDLLEVNMSDHPLNTSGALSDDGNESPERVISQEQEAEDFCFINNIKREIDEPNSPDNKNSSRENNVGMKSQISNHQSSERCPADKCHWKEILKRLKKPDLSVQVEQRTARNTIDAKTESDSAAVNADEDVPSIPDNNNVVERRDYSLPEHSLFSVYDRNGNSKNNAEYFLGDVHRTFYSDVVATASSRDGGNGMMVVEEMDEYGAVAEDEDEDDTMTKYEYDSFRSMIYDQSENGTGTGSLFSHVNAANAALGNSSAVEPQKIPDKSSVRQFCVQIGEHLFQCTFCSKTYTHISNFSRHFLSAHHGLRQEVPCPVCCRIFTRRDNMLTHMKQVHRITVARGSPLNVVKKYSDQNANVPPPPSSLTSTSNSF